MKSKYLNYCVLRLCFFLAFVLMSSYSGKANADYANNSILSYGNWYKMSISSTGIYKISYTELAEMGVPVSSINPKDIRIYHNGGGVLPVVNREFRYDDLVELPIYVHGENDGSFDENDYVLFYARGPVTWTEMSDLYKHNFNPYSDYSFAFLTTDYGEGKRISYADEIEDEASMKVTEFLDYRIIDNDDVNLNNMGATWYSDPFDVVSSRDYSFNFPNAIKNKESNVIVDVASRNQSNAAFIIKADGEKLSQLNFKKFDMQYTYALTKNTGNLKFNPIGDNVVINLSYTKSESSSIGWLNYIAVNVWRELIFTNAAMSFRNPNCNDSGTNYRYEIRNASGSLQVWDVANPVEPEKIKLHLNSNKASFVTKGAENNEFIAFDGSSFKKVGSATKISNQNLHSKYDFDYLIITHPDFMSQAERLKEIHSYIDNLEIEIVTPSVIYNEFSCGATDITAIRDYIRMLYNKSGQRLKYVLLFGDASYDFKNKSGKVCFVPTYESVASCSVSDCLATDDYYVCLDDHEGNMENGGSIIDIALGRIPVSTQEDADAMIDKIETYLSMNEDNMGPWRKHITFITDDDQSYYSTCAENLVDDIQELAGDDFSCDFDKIYLDAYPQITTSGGQRAPECNEAINNRVERGSLIVNYIGHGGEVGWSAERMLTNEDILSWRNSPRLHFMITASCEFSRYDDHTRTSAGELVYLNHNGGAIAMLTAGRVTNSGDNNLMMRKFYEHFFDNEDGEFLSMGDLYLYSKQDGIINQKRYVFFGDPALKFNYPENFMEINSINNHPANEIDTIRALDDVTIEGVVKDINGNVMTDFNGTAYINVYDKENTYTTYGDDTEQFDFKLRNSLIYSGKVPVYNGYFSADFTLPKDINYSYGNGLISLYAYSQETEAQGSFSNFVVGGMNPDADPDYESPELMLFIDDDKFIDGSITNENPILIAYIKDENGINTSGSGIGHDLTAKLSGATNKTYILNQYYDSPLNKDEYGVLTYRLYNLNEGEHELEFKAWDIYNNSVSSTIRFNVVKGKVIQLENLHNYPNPMDTYTNFVFEHNQNDNEINVRINIYNIVGQLVKTINETSYGTSMRISPIKWDGKSDNGVSLPAGIYLYNVTVTNSVNEKATEYSKLIIK
ncbi:MAG: type IX secretion system sortase PorU [Lentimicrobiaceae bacterium]|nr:type IX secretion system sortase PorU [Lentimicrobiaceae bacterium]